MFKTDWATWALMNKTTMYQIAQKFGGGFVRCLAETFMCADTVNAQKILTAFPAEFEQLYEMNLQYQKKRSQTNDNDQSGKG